MSHLILLDVPVQFLNVVEPRAGFTLTGDVFEFTTEGEFAEPLDADPQI